MNFFFFALSVISSPSVYAFATIPASGMASSNGSSSTSIRLASSKTSSDIAVVGCGVLGTSLCKQLLASPDFKGRSVTGITKTTNNHESIQKSVLGDDHDDDNDSSSSKSSLFNLSTFDDIPKEKQFKDVVFCAPPSGFDNYPEAIQNVIDTLWHGASSTSTDGSDGVFVFTSSGGIYGPGNGETINETTEIPKPTNPRTQRLVEAELNTMAAGGCILRLAGLYTLERGAHSYWIEKSGGVVKGSKDGIINLLHYDDAAGACLAALNKRNNGGNNGGDDSDVESVRMKTFLISDGHPTTRIGICESALKSKRFDGGKMPTFGKEDSAGKGKIYDGSWSNEFLAWEPRYKSFDEFMTNSQ